MYVYLIIIIYLHCNIYTGGLGERVIYYYELIKIKFSLGSTLNN